LCRPSKMKTPKNNLTVTTTKPHNFTSHVANNEVTGSPVVDNYIMRISCTTFGCAVFGLIRFGKYSAGATQANSCNLLRGDTGSLPLLINRVII